MNGRWRIYEWGFHKDFLKSDWAGRRVGSRGKEDDGKSSPKWHWPQKATTAQAATAASKGKLILRPLMSCQSILELTGGWGGHLDLPGAWLWTPLRTRLSTVQSGHFADPGPGPGPVLDLDPRSSPGPVQVQTWIPVLQCIYFLKNYLSLIFIYI